MPRTRLHSRFEINVNPNTTACVLNEENCITASSVVTNVAEPVKALLLSSKHVSVVQRFVQTLVSLYCQKGSPLLAHALSIHQPLPPWVHHAPCKSGESH